MAGFPPGVRLPALLWPARDGRDGAAPAGAADALAATLQALWRLPKVELHLHLEGALRAETVCQLARRYEPDSPLCAPDWQRGYWSFRDLAGFVVELGRVLRTCIRQADDYYRIAIECFEDLAAQHVAYAEVSVGPRTPGRPFYVPLEEMVAAVDQARQEVETRTALRAGLIVGLSRNHLAADAHTQALVRQLVVGAIRAREAGAAVVGVDLHGDEEAVPDVGPFVAAFRTAAEAGLGLRAHAGEGTGAAAVWDALRRLGVHRIAHGVRAVEDPALIEHLARARTPLDVCPTSNVLTGAVPSLAAHPVRALHEAGVVVTISSDDPLVFGTSVTGELALLAQCLGFSLPELGQLTAHAAARSFLPDPARAGLVDTVQHAWPR